MPEVSNAPDHEYNPEGLSVEALIKRLQQAPADTPRIYVETSGEDEGDVEILGRVVEVQWGRDGAVYLRVDATRKDLQDGWKELDQ